MKVSIKPKKVNQSNLTSVHELIHGRVYRFGCFLVSELETGNIIVIDTDEHNQVLTFESCRELAECLDDNDMPSHGEITSLAFELNVVESNDDLF